MGLDAVELVMGVEEAFGIAIADADTLDMRTPRAVADYLERRLPVSSTAVASERRAFYVVRRAGMATLGLPRAAFRPQARWEDLIPRPGRRRNWELLHHATGLAGWPPISLSGAFAEPTVGATATYLAARNAPRLHHQYRTGWTRAEIEKTLGQLIREQLGIDGFNWDDRFIEDLGLS